ncbi:MAG: transglutaminase-like domain-containing protein [Candidatus Thermoplasmatota archaeon]
MTKKIRFKNSAVSCFVVISIFLISGCTELISDLSSIKYVESPTHIQYTLSYGYTVHPTGTGSYEILYRCELPSVLAGSVTYEVLYDTDYSITTILNTSMIEWNISSDENQKFNLGITADITAHCFYITDLTGKGAQTIESIHEMHPELAAQYCHEQSNETIVFITPKNTDIVRVASEVYQQTASSNAVLVAKALFAWLKEHTAYSLHSSTDSDIQPAPTTLIKKTGDCDDLSFLYVSLCRSVGIPARFIRGYLLSEDSFGMVTATPHAWVEVFVGGDLGHQGWIPVECASTSSSPTADIHQNFGCESASHVRLFVDDGSNESISVFMQGISYKIFNKNRHMTIEPITQIQNYAVLVKQKLVITQDNQRSFE